VRYLVEVSRPLLVLVPLILLVACGGVSGPLSDSGDVVIDPVPQAGLPAGLIGFCEWTGSVWRIRILETLSGDAWIVVAHELLHVIGLPAGHGEPFPCLGGSTMPPAELVQVCAGDAQLLQAARDRGERHRIIRPLTWASVVDQARGYLAAAAGADLFGPVVDAP
jgi:hypothetical protein